MASWYDRGCIEQQRKPLKTPNLLLQKRINQAQKQKSRRCHLLNKSKKNNVKTHISSLNLDSITLSCLLTISKQLERLSNSSKQFCDSLAPSRVPSELLFLTCSGNDLVANRIARCDTWITRRAYGEVQGCPMQGQQCYCHLLTGYFIFENVLIVYGNYTRINGCYLNTVCLYRLHWQLDTLLPIYIYYELLITVTGIFLSWVIGQSRSLQVTTLHALQSYPHSQSFSIASSQSTNLTISCTIISPLHV